MNMTKQILTHLKNKIKVISAACIAQTVENQQHKCRQVKQRKSSLFNLNADSGQIWPEVSPEEEQQKTKVTAGVRTSQSQKHHSRKKGHQLLQLSGGGIRDRQTA